MQVAYVNTGPLLLQAMKAWQRHYLTNMTLRKGRQEEFSVCLCSLFSKCCLAAAIFGFDRSAVDCGCLLRKHLVDRSANQVVTFVDFLLKEGFIELAACFGKQRESIATAGGIKRYGHRLVVVEAIDD